MKDKQNYLASLKSQLASVQAQAAADAQAQAQAEAQAKADAQAAQECGNSREHMQRRLLHIRMKRFPSIRRNWDELNAAYM